MNSHLESLPSACCDGGPHVLLQADLVQFWGGLTGATDSDLAGSDYGRACASPEPASVIAVASGHALVIGGAPPFTYWLGHPGGMSGDLLVPRYWNIDFTASHLREAVARLDSNQLIDLGVVFETASGDCALIAACDCGPDWLYGVSAVSLVPGRYGVFSGKSSLGADLGIQVLRLAACEDSAG